MNSNPCDPMEMENEDGGKLREDDPEETETQEAPKDENAQPPETQEEPEQDVKKKDRKKDEELAQKYEDLNNRYLRMLAEYDNFRKRSQREKDSVYPTAVAETVKQFLPVIDSFERALACECSDLEFKKGIDMIFAALQKSLGDLEVTPVGEVGEPFDANLHNAVMHVDDEAAEKNVVSAVHQKGYKIGERVLRYAMVTVAN